MATVAVANSLPGLSRVRSALWRLPAALTLALAMLSAPALRDAVWLRFYLDFFGCVSFFSGAALRWWSTLYLAAAPANALVMRGPYSICRHPLDLANLLFGAALVLFLGSATFMMGFAIAAAGWFSLHIAAEEQWLQQTWGSAYRRYGQRVPRLLIRPWLLESPERMTVEVAKLTGELRWMAIWLWVPMIGQVLAQLRIESWWPHILLLP